MTAIDGFWIVNLEGKLLEVNQAYSEMSGYSEDELLAMNIQELEYSEAPDEVDKHIQFGVKKGFDRFESVHRKKDGRLYDVEINFRYQFKEQFFIVFIKDISERKRIEAHLSKIQKMESIGNLAGGIAHDFNNLLVLILGMSEILLEDLPQESLEYENAKEIFNAAKRAGDLVKQILVFSRQSEHKKTSVQIQKILKEVLTLSWSTIPSNIEIQKSIQPDCGFVMADPTQIHQITMNLITNAAHAVEGQNGIIDIGLKEVILQENDLSNSELKSGPYIRLSVSDNGIGMPQSIMSKIFDPYFTTKEQGKGTGLGLALVYGIIKEHSGEVKVYSELGKGTTFNVYLPLIGTKIKAIQETRTMGIPTGKESILLVDDELAVAKLEQQMLYRLGYRVTMKTDSCDALNTFTADPEAFDLVISDMTMPKMTGDQLTQKILSIKPDMPIIICTGFSEKINKDHAQRIGVGGFLMKPVMKSELGQMVRDVLDKSRHPR
ncbi:MAG: response regulator [Desulfobacter sp.]|nr:MAG: response regulator [Desulfobacter sp.]